MAGSFSQNHYFLAQELRRLADSVHEIKYDRDIERLVNVAVDKAKYVAQCGNYHVTITDDKFSIPKILNEVTRQLNDMGFKVTPIKEISQLAESLQPVKSITVDWK